MALNPSQPGWAGTRNVHFIFSSQYHCPYCCCSNSL